MNTFINKNTTSLTQLAKNDNLLHVYEVNGNTKTTHTQACRQFIAIANQNSQKLFEGMPNTHVLDPAALIGTFQIYTTSNCMWCTVVKNNLHGALQDITKTVRDYQEYTTWNHIFALIANVAPGTIKFFDRDSNASASNELKDYAHIIQNYVAQCLAELDNSLVYKNIAIIAGDLNHYVPFILKTQNKIPTDLNVSAEQVTNSIKALDRVMPTIMDHQDELIRATLLQNNPKITSVLQIAGITDSHTINLCIRILVFACYSAAFSNLYNAVVACAGMYVVVNHITSGDDISEAYSRGVDEFQAVPHGIIRITNSQHSEISLTEQNVFTTLQCEFRRGQILKDRLGDLMCQAYGQILYVTAAQTLVLLAKNLSVEN
jgi:hypothetical protein